jgi:formylglycine-generating enzyme required for sulfatase activity
MLFAVVCGAAAACAAFGADEEPTSGGDAGEAAAPPIDGEADGGPSGDGALEVCPSGRGPNMVLVEGSYQGTSFRFCVDSTEVTQKQYQEFVTGGGTIVTTHPACGTKMALGPRASCVGDDVQYEARADYPIVCVDFCDALAFCQWAGKRLCGRTGDGGPIRGPEDLGAQPQNEWYLACSQGGTHVYPYGETARSNACTVLDPDGGEAGTPRATTPVATLPGCVGTTVPVFDMVGNAREWVNACNGTASACATLGGDGTTPAPNARCADTAGGSPADQGNRRGIRCCADAR